MNGKKGKIYSEIAELRNLVLKECSLVNPNSTKNIVTDLQVLSIKLHKFNGDLKRIAVTLNLTALKKRKEGSEAAEGMINASIKILSSVKKQMAISNCSSEALKYVNGSINYLLKAQTSLKNNESAQALKYVEDSVDSLKSAISSIQGKYLCIKEFSISVKIEVSIHLLIMVENTLS